MKKTLLRLAACSAVLIAVPATAQDDGQATFTGPWVSGLVGYDSSRAGSSVDSDVDEDAFDDGIDGVGYGVGVGFDVAMGGLVIGAEGEWMESNASTRYDLDDDVGLAFANIETGRDLYVGARVGAMLGSKAMVYVKGGYTNATYNVLAGDDVNDTLTDVKLEGWRAGGGVEFALSKNAFLKAEYRYSNYNDGSVEFPNGVETDQFSVDVDRHQGVVGLGLRF